LLIELVRLLSRNNWFTKRERYNATIVLNRPTNSVKNVAFSSLPVRLHDFANKKLSITCNSISGPLRCDTRPADRSETMCAMTMVVRGSGNTFYETLARHIAIHEVGVV